MILPPTCDRVSGDMENEGFDEEKKEARMGYSTGFNDMKPSWPGGEPRGLTRDETAEPNKLLPNASNASIQAGIGEAQTGSRNEAHAFQTVEETKGAVDL